MEVSGPVLAPRRAVGAGAREERISFEGVGLPGEDIDGVGLTYVAGGLGRRARAQGGQLPLLLLRDGGGAGARGGAEVVLEHGARGDGVGVEAEARGALFAVASARAARGQRGGCGVFRFECESGIEGFGFV